MQSPQYMHFNGSKMGLPVSGSDSMASSLHASAQMVHPVQRGSSHTGSTTPWNPRSISLVREQSMGQPEKEVLNLWGVGVPKNLLSTISERAWVSVRPFGLYSHPPQAVGTLTRGPQEATFCPMDSRSFTRALKSL